MIRDWNVLQNPNQNQKFSELQHYFPMIPTYTSPKHKVSNLKK